MKDCDELLARLSGREDICGGCGCHINIHDPDGYAVCEQCGKNFCPECARHELHDDVWVCDRCEEA